MIINPVLSYIIRINRRSHISRIFYIISFLFISLPLHATTASNDIDFNNANALMRHIDQLWRSDSAHSIMTMTVKTRRYSRTLKIESWAKGKEKSLIIIRAPKKDRGIATLKVNDNIWNYLPKINRVTKVPASLMSGSWMGSHFTNDDLVKENTYEDEYNSKITFKGIRDGIKVIEITSIPKENAAIVWGKVVTLINQEQFVPINSKYFNEESLLVRIMRFSKVEEHGGRLIPMKMTLQPLDKPNESTVVEYLSIRFDEEISDRLFSIKRLKR